jgi:hypothetical protein
MSILTPIPPTTPLPARVFLAIPLIGWIARDVFFGDKDNIWYAMVIVLTALFLSVSTWGLPALVRTALALVPVCFFFLIVLSRP